MLINKIVKSMVNTGGPSVFLCLSIWYALGLSGFLEQRYLPQIYDVITTLVSGYSKGYLLPDIKVSLIRVACGFLVGGSLGVMFGFFTGRDRVLRAIFFTPLNALRALPAVALVPLLIRVLGIDEGARLVIVSSGVFFPVWFSTHLAAVNINSDYTELGRSLKLSKKNAFLHIYLPAATPAIVSGLRLGLAMAFVMMYISEWMASNSGIGYRMSIAYTVSNTELIVAGLIQLAFFALVFDELFGWGTRKLFPWVSKV